jgi:hypothetical protein
MEEISDNIKNQIFAIEVGTPFWEKTLNSENVLILNNKGKDPLVEGKITALFPTLLKAPFRWLLAKVSGRNLPFAHAFYMQNHAYSWSSVKPEITSFLEEKIKQ